MIQFINNLFRCPLTRKEVLKRAKKYKDYGLCYAIFRAFLHYGITIDGHYSTIRNIFPLFEVENATQFKVHFDRDYWWNKGVWNTGRSDFLDWLIEQYKDDKTDLRKL